MGMLCLLLFAIMMSTKTVLVGAETTIEIDLQDHDSATINNVATAGTEHQSLSTEEKHSNGTTNTHEEEHYIHESHPAHAVIFAPFSVTLGVVVFFLLSR